MAETEKDSAWQDKPLPEILERWDVILYETDSFRQKPIISRAEAKAIEQAERNFKMIQALMTADCQRRQHIHWIYTWGEEG